MDIDDEAAASTTSRPTPYVELPGLTPAQLAQQMRAQVQAATPGLSDLARWLAIELDRIPNKDKRLTAYNRCLMEIYKARGDI